MSWWSGMDKEIYINPGEAKRLANSGPSSGADWWSSALGSRCTRPTAVLARQIATPNYETLWFIRLARRYDFDAMIIEHRSDRFTVHNPYKRSLATLPIVVGRSRNGRLIIRRQKTVHAAAAESQPFEAVATQLGESLITYHHRKLLQVLGAEAPRVIDIKDVMPASVTTAAAYYLEFFRMLTGPFVLFEDFVADEQTAGFFRNTVLPAYRKSMLDIGRKPQIVKMVPGPRTSSPMWYAYPAAVADDPTWIRPTRMPDRAQV